MNDVNQRIVAMIARAESVLREDTANADRATVMLFAVLTIGLFLIATLAAVSLSVLRRSAREVEHAYALLEQANADLEERIAERTADLQEANEEIQRFAYIVSHDLRSPLVNIMGFTSELEALRDDLLGLLEGRQTAGQPKQGVSPAVTETTLRRDYNEALAFIKSSIAKMDRLINAILHLSRAGRRQFNIQPIDLNQLFAEIRSTVAHRLQDNDIALHVGPLPQVTSDRLALEQVFSNLLDNAIKYMRNGIAGRIDVSVADTATHYLISVADNGRGIAQNDLERIFDLFRRAGVQDRPGEGIGLAHVRTLVRRLGGSIKVDSTPDQGTTFTVALPKRWAPAR
jgi:signal transduction histidine kinase